MGSIKLPPTLSVEEEDEWTADQPRYDEPNVKTIRVTFGTHVVAEYVLIADSSGQFGYTVDSGERGATYRRYDTPEEFVAAKLQKLFRIPD